jgi:hypothetical protein
MMPSTKLPWLCRGCFYWSPTGAGCPPPAPAGRRAGPRRRPAPPPAAAATPAAPAAPARTAAAPRAPPRRPRCAAPASTRAIRPARGRPGWAVCVHAARLGRVIRVTWPPGRLAGRLSVAAAPCVSPSWARPRRARPAWGSNPLPPGTPPMRQPAEVGGGWGGGREGRPATVDESDVSNQGATVPQLPVGVTRMVRIKARPGLTRMSRIMARLGVS